MGDSSISLILSGNSTVLEAHYFPPIELSPNSQYVLGLVELLTFNAIPNIDQNNNKFFIDGENPIVFPTGSYEITDIEKYLKKHLKKEITFSLTANNNTLKSEITCSKKIDFQKKGSIGSLLGFVDTILKENDTHTSSLPVKIIKVNAIRVECNITGGAFINGEKGHTIHEFFPAVPPGYKIIEVPKKVIYLPIAVKSIPYIQLKIVDQLGHLINLRGETITIRLHIKAVK